MYQIFYKIGSPNVQRPLSYLNIIYEKIGDEYYRTPTYMTFDEYLDWKAKEQERDYFAEQGQASAELVKKLERELKPGQIVRISGIQARANPGRYVVGSAQVLKDQVELDSKIQTAEALDVLISGEKQQVLRLNLPASEFEALRLKLEKTSGVWLQQGDIDLTPFSFEFEVRDEDHKPALPADQQPP